MDYDEWEAKYRQEAELSASILQRNRHNSVDGRWYGPEPEPCKAGASCECAGCLARFWVRRN
jgi:hypothetical protein